ncbi:lysophospholipase family protein [Aspergillus glaucus CBS 516.65]|uniref:Lysophospholipase n=1 Tax=Aspergillus glaucus CBS 516.65 TaxID=1160497 RepID=A0A1L9V859_ASPGL|nr:hypothetical protein ASPGLDRAFT_39402 [Aspergillus glaucus CBS 516.65]OJJ80114.1 hypothetical protein ASPGLDRAFT_39402 [Aspergillus glaucus CBS 516.65]
MKFSVVSWACSLAGLAAASPTPSDVNLAIALSRRALPNAPDGYTPANVTCPTNRPSIRGAGSLSSNETEWLRTRRSETIEPMKDFFDRTSIPSFDAVSYIKNHANNVSELPNIAIAVSGGGYRALTNGAGALKAFDSRTENSTSSGHLGGLLQSSTYVSGLSGGSWLLGSVYLNNFTTISALQTHDKGDVWQFSRSILKGPDDGGVKILDSAQYWRDLVHVVDGKKDAGFNTSLTDYWGRALSYQFINDTDGGVDYTWSSIAQTDDFKAGKMPMPLVVADGRAPGELVVGSNSTVYEFNPWEFGSFDPTIFGFAPLEYLGSPFENGELPQGASCVRGFDNAGFVMGTSSTLFNQGLLRLNKADLPDVIKSVATHILEDIGEANDDIAIYSPNPFYGYRNSTAAYSNANDLDVVDGGEDQQNLPLHPLIQPQREVDVIFAVDSSADTSYNWPDGHSLVATYERSLNSTGIANGTVFPAVPDRHTFINQGLNERPTFFGCDAANLTGPAPLVVYLPNSPYSAYSNTSTFQLKYSDEERDSIITNGYEVVTMGNATEDKDWPTCVGCAILSRSLNRTGTTVPQACQTCFQRYCWNGTVDSRDPGDYEPSLLLSTSTSGSSRKSLNRTAAVIALAAVFLATV